MNTSVQSFRHNHIYKTYLGSDEQIHVKSRIPDSIPNSKLLKSIEYLNLSNNCYNARITCQNKCSFHTS